MTVRCLSENQKQQICIYHEEDGLTIKEIADDYKVSSRTVSRVLDEYGSVPKGNRIVELLKKYNVTESELKTLLKRYRTKEHRQVAALLRPFPNA